MAVQFFDFLKLPGEIRNQIYELLLTRPDHRPGPHGTGLRVKEPLGLSPAILGLNRQVHTECCNFLYSGWFSAHPRMLRSFPCKVDNARPVKALRHTSLIRKFYIEVRLDVDHPWDEDDLKEAFSGVDALYIYAWQPSYGLCDVEPLKKFSRIRGVGKAKVEGCGISIEFAKWLETLIESNDSADLDLHQPNLPAWSFWGQGNR